MIDFVDYEIATRSTAVYPEAESGSYNALQYLVLGLTSEAGEVAGKLKKVWRDSEGVMTPETETAIVAELGDILWYLARFADELGYNLEEIALGNLDKLNSRRERGVIGGSGDTR